ncbi:MAG: phosphoglycerate mutase (2,3-diphosphoglycerate-independent), partial [Myxococcales bacterium]
AGRDTALFFNFRSDRAREMTEALALPDFHGFDRGSDRVTPFARYVCMTSYDETWPLPVAFGKIHYENMFGQLLAGAGMAQFRCAETEKFAHVTFFFNGGRQDPFEREERELVPSPRDVNTYDQKPEMSAAAVTEAVVRAMTSERFPFVLVNFANPDMVGHSGMLGPAVAAVEAVDRAIGTIIDAARAHDFTVLITADHGNCELMRDPVTGQPHTAHTTNPVPFVLVDPAMSGRRQLRSGGRLCDVAPTMLALLGLPQPIEMTGQSLLA